MSTRTIPDNFSVKVIILITPSTNIFHLHTIWNSIYFFVIVYTLNLYRHCLFPLSSHEIMLCLKPDFLLYI